MGDARIARGGLATMLLCCVSSAALAQTGPVTPSATLSAPPGAAAPTVGEVVVTAQRRNESLSRTPVAVQVVSADTLAKAQIKSELDLRFATPGLSIRSGQSSESISFSLRGQSQDPQSDTRPGVLPYFNDVPIAGQGNTTSFYDLQSVQVLKGPQGTLFGRSATGGAVLYTTAQPTNTFGGYVSGLLGNYDARQTEAALNVPLVKDMLLARVSGFWSDRDGMQHDYVSGARVGDLRKDAERASVTFNDGSFHNTVVFDHDHAYGQSTQAVISGLLPVNPAGGPPYFPAVLLYSGTATPAATATGIATLAAVTGASTAAATAYYNSYFANPLHPTGGLEGILATQQAAGPFRPYSDGRNFYETNINTLTNTSTYQLSPNITLKNIFGYIDNKTNLVMDEDSSPYNLQESVLGPYTKSTQYTDEVQVAGNLFNDRLIYVVGGFYSNESSVYFANLDLFDILFGGGNSTYHHRLTSETYAAFTQETFKLNDTGLAVIGGIRYTSEKIGVNIFADDLNASTCGDVGYDCNQTRTFNNINYTFGIQDQLDRNLLLYGVTRQAYKNGGFNGDLAPKIGLGETGGDGFDAELVRDVEGGAKFAGRIHDIPVRANLALYYSWISNDERTAYVLNPGPATAIVNVPEGRTYGAELDGQFQPTRWLTLGGTFNYTHATYSDGNTVVTTIFGSVPEVYDRVPDTPVKSGSAFADLRFSISNDLAAVLHGDIYYEDENFTSPRSFNYAGTTIPSYSLTNFRVGLEHSDGWSLTANVKNAFDKTYYVGGFALGEIYSINSLIPGDRRTFTLEARYKF